MYVCMYLFSLAHSLHWHIRARKSFILLTAIFPPCKPVSGTELPFSIEMPNEWVTFLMTSSALGPGLGQAEDASKRKSHPNSKGTDPKQGQGLHEAQVLFFQLPIPSFPPQWPYCASCGHWWLGSWGWSQDQGKCECLLHMQTRLFIQP